jgi:hypothetical protein
MYQDGAIFKWRPYDEGNGNIFAIAGNFAVSHDGSSLAVGEALG